jgi:hypothetical protein
MLMRVVGNRELDGIESSFNLYASYFVRLAASIMNRTKMQVRSFFYLYRVLDLTFRRMLSAIGV